jgi:hypothetical protein
MMSFFSDDHNYAPYIVSGESEWRFCFDTGKRRTVPELKVVEHHGHYPLYTRGVTFVFGNKRKARASNGKRHGLGQQLSREDFESWMTATDRIREPRMTVSYVQTMSDGGDDPYCVLSRKTGSPSVQMNAPLPPATSNETSYSEGEVVLLCQ